VIPYGRQDISEEDVDAVVQVLRSDFLTQGPCVPKFEAAVAEYCSVRHAVAVNSATSALHIACLALGLQQGDILWTSPITFVASANAGLYCGAEVDFVDIDPVTCNMSVSALKIKLIQAAAENRLPKIVVPVHLSGLSADMAAIAALGREYGFRIIEDASHAIGGTYGDHPVGSCQYSAITVFSFHPVKIITSGEGGMALTNDAGLAHRMQLLRSHGITRDEAFYEGPNEGPWYYQQLELGFNYRMTDICAALGLSQMSRLDAFVTARARLAARYDDLLQSTGLILQGRSSAASSAHHLYVVRLPPHLEASHLSIFHALRGAKIGVNLHYIPVYKHPHYRKLKSDWGVFPQSESYYRSAISLPLFATLTMQDQDTVVAALKRLVD